MKKNSKMKILLPSLLGAALVAGLVSGAVVKAESGLTVLDKVLQLLQLAKEVNQTPAEAGNADLGAQAATSDDITIGKFNALALVTDPTNSSNSNFQNFVQQFVGLVGDVGNATNTPLSVRNTWAQTVYATNAFVKCTGSASTSIRAYSGTSTVPSSPDILTTATATLTNTSALMSGVLLRQNIAGEIVTSAPTSTLPTDTNQQRGTIPVLPGEYLNVFVKSDDARNQATSTIWRGCTDLMAGVTIEGKSTSTVNY